MTPTHIFSSGDNLLDRLFATHLECSGVSDVTLSPRDASDLLLQTAPLTAQPLVPFEGRTRRFGPLFGASLEETLDGGLLWRLAEQQNEILFRARRLVRARLRALGKLDAFTRVWGNVKQIEAVITDRRVRILDVIAEATSAGDMIDRLSLLH